MSDTIEQVLVFELGDDTYCVNIDYVTEIVDVGEVTEIPNSPPHVQGVMDLRGRTTSIVDPKIVFDIETPRESKRIIVFDPEINPDQNAVGWLVDEVHQVRQLDEENMDTSHAGSDSDSIKGVIKRDEDFMIWVNPVAVHT